MTDTTSSAGDDDRVKTARRMRAIAAELTAAGLDAQVNETHGVLDVTATWHRPGSKAIDLTVDEDHYIQLSWWNPDDATPGQVVATIRGALAAITGTC
jgi:hypothetical protein